VTKNAGLFYIEVGEGDPNGFSTNLLVQQLTPLVQDMINNPEKYKGKKVKVDFREMPDGQGFTFQALMGIEMAN
jgi:DNA-binding HxlR family transcriptional regulator